MSSFISYFAFFQLNDFRGYLFIVSMEGSGGIIKWPLLTVFVYLFIIERLLNWFVGYMFAAFCFRMKDIGPLCCLLLTLGALVQISPGFLLTGGNTHNIRFKICNVWLPRIIIWFFSILNRLHLNHARRVFGWDYFWNVTKTYTYFYSEFFLSDSGP